MSDNATRLRIVAAADDLFYHQGFEHTSFADIASAVGISRGNFYHHFKSKDEILHAVIAMRMDRTRGLLERWDAQGKHPRERIQSFVELLIVNQSQIMRSGCPVGSLCSELAKLGHPNHTDAAALFTLFRAWLKRQFELMGCKKDPDVLALHVLARSQGVATLAHAYRDAAFVEREVALLSEWLRAIEEGK